MIWFSFEIRCLPKSPLDIILYSLAGQDPPIHRITGKVRAWTRWGARRYLARKCGSRLIEILKVERTSK